MRNISAKKEILKFIRALVPFLIVLLFLDRLIGYGFEYNYNRQTRGSLYRMNFAIDSMKADIIVTGSSRATHHYNSEIISELTGESFYNAGSEGRGVIYSAAIVSSILDRYRPKLIIIDLRPDEFRTVEDEDLAALLPYHKNKSVLPYIDSYSNFERIKLKSHIYPYNSLLTTIIAGRSERVDANSFDRGGYVPMEGLLKDTSIGVFNDTDYKVDRKKIDALEKLVLRLEHEKVNCLLVISPLYFHYRKGTTLSVVDDMSRRLKYVKAVCFGNNSIFFDATKFDDPMHLNSKGADDFSRFLSEIINTPI